VNNKSCNSGHGSKQQLAAGAGQTLKPKSQQKQKNFGTLAEQNNAYPSSLSKPH
jgi:hypothetical protein